MKKIQVASLLRILDPMPAYTSKYSKHFWSLTIPYHTPKLRKSAHFALKIHEKSDLKKNLKIAG